MHLQFRIRIAAHFPHGDERDRMAFLTHGPKCAVKKRRSADIRGLRRPVPTRRGVSTPLRITAGRIVSRRPRSVPYPRRDFPRLLRWKPPNLISGWNRNMCWAGATGTVPRFRALGNVVPFPRCVRPCARSFDSKKNARVALALSKQQLR